MDLVDETDLNAFETIYNKYKQKAFLVAKDILCNDALAEECVSEVFLSIAKSFQIINNLNANKQLKYIVICSRNKALDLLKKEKKHSMEAVEFDDEEYFTDNDYSKFEMEHWRRCIGKLNQTDRDSLYLRCVLQLDYKKISRSLGISRNAARARVFKAKAHLKEIIRKEEK